MIQVETVTVHEKNTSKNFCEFHDDLKHFARESWKKSHMAYAN